MVNATTLLVHCNESNSPKGVPSLPPKAFGFRHFALNPLYLMQGHLYHTPSSEAEFCLFHISTDDRETGKTPLYPLGILV
jgi:hypothetical protein